MSQSKEGSTLLDNVVITVKRKHSRIEVTTVSDRLPKLPLLSDICESSVAGIQVDPTIVGWILVQQRPEISRLWVKEVQSVFGGEGGGYLWTKQCR